MAQRQHLRLDTIKMFEPDEANMNLAMELLKTKNRSEAHRYALQFFCLASDLKPFIEAMQHSKSESQTRHEELYFIVQGLVNSVTRLSKQIEALDGGRL